MVKYSPSRMMDKFLSEYKITTILSKKKEEK